MYNLNEYDNLFWGTTVKGKSLSELLYDPDNYTHRRNIIFSIENMMNNHGFNLYYERFVVGYSKKQKKTGFKREDFKKFYISYNFMDYVIGKFCSYMPKLHYKTDIDESANALIKKGLRDIKWEVDLYDSICQDLEAKGDVFLSIYFEGKDDKIPKIRQLQTEGMIDIILDENMKPTMYVYEEITEGKKVDGDTGQVVTTGTITKRYLYEKGKTTVYENGKKIVYPNKDSMKDIISIIHIPTYKNAKKAFSNIPAYKYMSDALTLDRCTTALRQTLDYQGFSVKHIVDGELEKGSKAIPGGYVGIITDKKTLMRGIQAKVLDFQIKNNLEANFTEIKNVKSALFEKAKLVAPDTEQIVGKTDSAKVFQHFRLPLETKVRKYRDNIICGMEVWFKVLLEENNMLTDDLEGFTFFKDDVVIATSIDEKALADQLTVSTGTEDIKSIKEKNGDDPKEIARLEAEREKEKQLETLNKQKK